MAVQDWNNPAHTLAAVGDLLRTPLSQTVPKLSQIIGDVVEHRALIMLTGDCVASPLRTWGDPAITEAVDPGELAGLADTVTVGQPWSGRLAIATQIHPVLAVAAAPKDSAGSLLVVVLGDRSPVGEEWRTIVQLVWDLAVSYIRILNAQVEPTYLAQSRVAWNTREQAVAELSETHGATLTAVLGALRSRNLPDAVARRTATDLAVSALVELRAGGEPGESGDVGVDEAFTQLADKLALLMRYNAATLELSGPGASGFRLPADIATAARAVVRSAILTMLEQPDVSRIRVAWDIESAMLRITVRDDGPGTLTADTLGVRRLASRLAALGSDLDLDAVPGWGTTLEVRLRLSSPATAGDHPVGTLNPRELDVLRELTRGRRNRQIAQDLHISEHTVKFHVGNILDKLGVASRGEAAAAARDLGLVPAARHTV